MICVPYRHFVFLGEALGRAERTSGATGNPENRIGSRAGVLHTRMPAAKIAIVRRITIESGGKIIDKKGSL